MNGSWRLTAAALGGTALLATPALAQRGMGDSVGVARMAEKPPVVTIAGTLESIKVGPCEHTTGHAQIGVHLLLTSGGERLNVHLGPRGVAAPVIAKLSVGDEVSVNGFRTDKMAKGHYVAQELRFGDEVVALRDQRLRPVWAAGQGRKPARAVYSCPPRQGLPTGAAWRGRRGYYGLRAGYGPRWRHTYYGPGYRWRATR